MPDYTPQQQDLVASKGGEAANPSGCSNPYEVVLARADESQASLSDSILAGRSTRIGLFSIAYGMWVAVICLVGQVLSLFSDGGKEAMIADLLSILLIVLSGAFIAMLVFDEDLNQRPLSRFGDISTVAFFHLTVDRLLLPAHKIPSDFPRATEVPTTHYKY